MTWDGTRFSERMMRQKKKLVAVMVPTIFDDTWDVFKGARRGMRERGPAVSVDADRPLLAAEIEDESNYCLCEMKNAASSVGRGGAGRGGGGGRSVDVDPVSHTFLPNEEIFRWGVGKGSQSWPVVLVAVIFGEMRVFTRRSSAGKCCRFHWIV